jgi:hypothetical protein
VAVLLYHDSGIALSCHVMIAELGRPDAIAPYPKGDEDPDVGIGPGSLFVAVRCPGLGEVAVEIWAGDPGLPAGWLTRFDGELETKANGFDAGENAQFHIAAAPGRYRVRVDVHLDLVKEADIVRFVFPENENLAGRVLSP